MIARTADLNLFLVFEALLKEGNVTRAAKQLGISQPALSEALGRLRRLMNDELFVRTPGGMVPTPRALQSTDAIRDALAALVGVINSGVAFVPAQVDRIYRIAAVDYVEITIIAALNARLAIAAPGIHLRMIAADGRSSIWLMDRGQADFAIGVFARTLPKRFDRMKLLRERAICLARRKHPALGEGLTLDTYARLPHVVCSYTGEVNRAIVDRALAKHGRRRTVGMTVTSPMSLPYVMEKTDMIATQPERIARKLVKIGALALHEPPIPLPPWDIELVWGRGAAKDPAASWLRTMIKDVCAGL